MPFTQIEPGDATAKYTVAATHAATGLTLYVSFFGDANGVIAEADAESALIDLAAVVASDPRFSNLLAQRVRSAVDTWTTPAPPESQPTTP